MSRLHRATTRHVASAFPFVGSDATAEGVVIGQDNLTGEVFAYDPWVASDRGVISGPNVVVFGTIGSGKSAVVKCYLLRSLVFGTHARVLDPKGEYVRIAHAVTGSQVVRVGLDGTVQINPLDPAIRPAQQRALIEALVEATASSRLPVIERAVLAATLDWVRHARAEPTLAGLRDALWTPPEEVTGPPSCSQGLSGFL